MQYKKSFVASSLSAAAHWTTAFWINCNFSSTDADSTYKQRLRLLGDPHNSEVINTSDPHPLSAQRVLEFSLLADSKKATQSKRVLLVLR